VRLAILPDWWEDSLADVPANRALVEGRVSKHLDVPIRVLRDPDQPISIALPNQPRFKHSQGTSPEDLQATALIACRTAAIAERYVQHLPPFQEIRSVAEVRGEIVSRGEQINLDSLLQFCWRNGILVLYLRNLPKRSKKFDAMAMFCGKTPVIVLASGKDGPPWLAFHLAHELAHVMVGHVREGGEPITDTDLRQDDKEADEQAANRYAKELLEGPTPPVVPRVYGTTGEKLASHAMRAANVDPGSFIMAFAYNAQGQGTNRWGVAQAALKYLGLDSGGQEKVAALVREHLVHDKMPEPSARFIEGVLSSNG
jgi:uncharacterized protein DUF955